MNFVNIPLYCAFCLFFRFQVTLLIFMKTDIIAQSPKFSTFCHLRKKTMSAKAIDKYIEDNALRFEAEFFDWLRIPSISTIPAHAGDVKKAAEWIADRLSQMGLQPELIETRRHPLVYAETPAVPGAPTILIYGHFDVQPVDPLDLWTTPPFEPTVRDGNVFARGASDDKGQLLTHVYAAEAVLKEMGRLPFQLKFLFEGEEEDGSDSITEYVNTHREKLACDCLIVSDGAMFGPGQPAITYGHRGIMSFELMLTGPNRDLHSGVFGGAAALLKGPAARAQLSTERQQGLKLFFLLLVAFLPAAVIGGLGSLGGAIFAAILLGVIEMFLTFYIGAITTPLVLFAIMLVFLFLRPQGISGRIAKDKV